MSVGEKHLGDIFVMVVCLVWCGVVAIVTWGWVCRDLFMLSACALFLVFSLCVCFFSGGGALLR